MALSGTPETTVPWPDDLAQPIAYTLVGTADELMVKVAVNAAWLITQMESSPETPAEQMAERAKALIARLGTAQI